MTSSSEQSQSNMLSNIIENSLELGSNLNPTNMEERRLLTFIFVSCGSASIAKTEFARHEHLREVRLLMNQLKETRQKQLAKILFTKFPELWIEFKAQHPLPSPVCPANLTLVIGSLMTSAAVIFVGAALLMPQTDAITVHANCPFVPKQPANVGVTIPEIRAGQKYDREAIERELHKENQNANAMLFKIDDERIQKLAWRTKQDVTFDPAFLDDMAADKRNCDEIFVIIRSNEPCILMNKSSQYFEADSPEAKLQKIGDLRKLGDDIKALFSGYCSEVPLKFSIWRAKHRT